MKKENESDILLEVLCYGVRSYCISQDNQCDYNSGSEITNYTL